MIAEKLLQDPQILKVARDNVERWQRQNGPSAAMEEWSKLLAEGNVRAVVLALLRLDDEGMRMRSSSPFVGVLDVVERDLALSIRTKMKREHVEHILRAAADICKENEFCVIGSQAILSEYPGLQDDIILRSMECDLYPEHAPEKSEELNAIGELSQFHETYGYYADGVSPDTAVVPEGWKERRILIEIQMPKGARVLGWCLETHDLLISKFVAGREKDLAYCAAVVRLGLVSIDTLHERLLKTDVTANVKRRVAAFVDVAARQHPNAK